MVLILITGLNGQVKLIGGLETHGKDLRLVCNTKGTLIVCHTLKISQYQFCEGLKSNLAILGVGWYKRTVLRIEMVEN